MENKHDFEEFGFTELMKRPKPELCDYVMHLRGVIESMTVPVREPAPRHMISPQGREYVTPVTMTFPDSIVKKKRGRKKKNS